MNKNEHFLPRLIRLKDIPYYLGMDRKIFNKEVKPYLAEITIGVQGKAFDRLDLDNWVDYYKVRGGRPSNYERLKLWDVKERQGSSKEERLGILTNRFRSTNSRKHWIWFA